MREVLNLYQTGIDKFLGNSFNKKAGSRLNSGQMRNSGRNLTLTVKHGLVNGLILQDLIAPKNEVDNLLDDIEAGKIKFA